MSAPGSYWSLPVLTWCSNWTSANSEGKSAWYVVHVLHSVPLARIVFPVLYPIRYFLPLQKSLYSTSGKISACEKPCWCMMTTLFLTLTIVLRWNFHFFSNLTNLLWLSLTGFYSPYTVFSVSVNDFGAIYILCCSSALACAYLYVYKHAYTHFNESISYSYLQEFGLNVHVNVCSVESMDF